MMWLEAHLVDVLRIGGAVAVAVGVLILLGLVARRDRRGMDREPDVRLSLSPVLDQTQVLPVLGRHRAGRQPVQRTVRHPERVSTVYRSVEGGRRG